MAMATPDFILTLRSMIGHHQLWLSGVTAVVLREAAGGGREVLLVRRADSGAWTPVTGIIDPGEQPARAAIREVREETEIDASPEALVWVHSLPPQTYENGDQSQYLDLVFRCSYVAGTPYPGDGENTEARWFALDALPEMSAGMLTRLDAALSDSPTCRFEM